MTTSPPKPPLVAYACMEYALHDDMPSYAGGLGVLAGDVLRAAGDVPLPLVGVGLAWSEAYTEQELGPGAWPVDRHPPIPRDRLRPTGVETFVTVRGRRMPLTAHVLEGEGHAPLYLIEPIADEDRWITRRLYQGGPEDRVAQEVVLGAGGVRVLQALGIPFDIFHVNEGHAVLAALELARQARAAGASLQEALADARLRVVFTTHTPTPAGNEAHGVAMLLEQGGGLNTFTAEELEAIAGDPFDMTVAALRLCRAAHGVSQLHAETARRMWAHVEDATPIQAITNGVHVPTWQDPRVRRALADGDPMATHLELKGELLDVIAERTGVRFDRDALLVGFARRMTPYKRADLVFRHLERLRPLLSSGRLQLVFAGKAHPAAAEGKGIVVHLAEVTREFPASVVFLDRHDMALGRLLTRGCDVWLNTPRRPMEACGTSGMKAALNGVLNLSILDGWWAEGCRHGENGWQFGSGYEGHGQDEHDALDLCRVLLDEVMPAWLGDRERWATMMRAAARTVEEQFTAARMLAEYSRLLYAPATAATD